MVLGVTTSRRGRPRLCRACGNLIGAESDECSYCGAKDRITAGLLANPLRLLGPLGPSRGITIAIVAYYAIMVLASRLGGGTAGDDLPGLIMPSFYGWREFVLFGGLEPSLVGRGEVWRLVTSMFMHLGIVHLAFNALALVQLGPTAEDLYGRAKFFVIFVVAGIVGNVASLFWGWGGAGASGSLFGILGSFVAYPIRLRSRAGDAARSYAVQSLIYGVVMGFVIAQVNWVAHLGGFVGGLAAGLVLGPGEPLRLREERVVLGATWAMLLVTIASFLAVAVTITRYYLV
jgi:membrane associated rhomboid family serine protease